MTQYSFLFGAILIVFGLVLAFCGNKFLTIVITILTALATLVIGVYFTALFVDSVFNPEDVKDYAVWIILALWCVIAILAGWFIAKKRKWLGGWKPSLWYLTLSEEVPILPDDLVPHMGSINRTSGPRRLLESGQLQSAPLEPKREVVILHGMLWLPIVRT